jgi:CelD/BcsL family acetyltransferase involved in cellulose biosynthesis
MHPRIRLNSRTLTQLPELKAIAAEWKNLCERCGSTPFQHPEWIIAWAEAFSPDRVRVIEVRRENTLVGLAPLLIYPRDGDHVLAFMAGGVSDYLDIVVDPEYETEVVSALFNTFSGLDRWTILDLTDLPSSSVLHRAVPGLLASPHDHCSSVFLPATVSELLQSFSKRQRANIRQSHSRIERAGGGSIEMATAETLPEFLEDLFRLHTSRWRQGAQPGVLADEKVKTFHRKAAPGLLSQDILRVYRLRLAARTIAVVYTLVRNSTMFCYLQGYDPEFADLSPGTFLMFSAMEDAIRSGLKKFDMLRGDEAYKQHWKPEVETTSRMQCDRATANSIGKREFAVA